MTNLKTRKINKAGFTLFVAMVVSSLLLAVGFSISNIILKQLLLAGSGKDSQVAFYAADSGAECAQFWDAKDSTGASLNTDGPFATSTDVKNFSIKCGSGLVGTQKTTDGNAGKNATSTLVIDYSSGDYKACSVVVVAKGFTNNGTEDIPFTKVISRGYNASKLSDLSGCDTTNKRTVERGLMVQY